MEHAVEGGNGVVEGGGFGEGFARGVRVEAGEEEEKKKGGEKGGGIQHHGGEGDTRLMEMGVCVVRKSPKQNKTEQSRVCIVSVRVLLCK